jgi:cell wall-associated NlpC family hydrolase
MATATRLGRGMPARLFLILVSLALVVALGPPAFAGGSPPRTLRMQRVDTVITVAQSLKGVPYKWGGTSRRGFDCSGYTRFVFAKIGEHLPRTSSAQYAEARKVAKQDVQRGDLVFFAERGRVYHVGIYAGDRKIWHSPHTGARVRLERIWTSKWRAGRVVV